MRIRIVLSLVFCLSLSLSIGCSKDQVTQKPNNERHERAEKNISALNAITNTYLETVANQTLTLTPADLCTQASQVSSGDLIDKRAIALHSSLRALVRPETNNIEPCLTKLISDIAPTRATLKSHLGLIWAITTNSEYPHDLRSQALTLGVQSADQNLQAAAISFASLYPELVTPGHAVLQHIHSKLSNPETLDVSRSSGWSVVLYLQALERVTKAVSTSHVYSHPDYQVIRETASKIEHLKAYVRF